MYPCKMPETGGKWFTTPQGFILWECTNCVVAHERSIVEMLDLDFNETDEVKINKAKSKLNYLMTLKKLNNFDNIM